MYNAKPFSPPYFVTIRHYSLSFDCCCTVRAGLVGND
jgi:hypothetical protein